MSDWPEVLWLVRHAESRGNVARAAAYAAKAEEMDIPDTDDRVPLSDLGRVQAGRLGAWFAARPAQERPQGLVSSPYARAVETARLLSARAGIEAPLALDERFRDREQGILDRLTWFGIERRYPQEAARRRAMGKFWYRPPGGESWADVATRVRSALADMRLDLAGRRVLVVAHDVPILLVRYALDGLEPGEAVAMSGSLANCSLTTYRTGPGGRPRLVGFNDTSALDGQP